MTNAAPHRGVFSRAAGWIFLPLRLLPIAAACLMLTSGCITTGGTPRPKPVPLANVLVSVRADGVRADPGPAVVWIEPEDRSRFTQGPTVKIDLDAPRGQIIAAGTNALWAFRNTTGLTLNVSLRTPDGKITELGEVPGPGTSFAPMVLGPVEVMVAGIEQPIARVYGVPSPYVQLIKLGEQALFPALPKGSAVVSCWHPTLKGSSQQVKLRPNGTANVTLTLTKN